MQYRKLAFVAVVLILVLTAAVPAFAQGQSPVAPLVGQDSPTAIPGRYIVVFKDSAPEGAVENAMSGLRDVQVDYVYTDALRGFAAALPDHAVEGLRHNPHVDYIEVDSTVTLEATQSPATWGLDRIDQDILPLSNSYTYDATGSGITAYIIDTGIFINHTDFGGRASVGYDAYGGNGIDCNGHGTHVSGTVGGTAYGVAKDISLVAVRVLDCGGSGTTSGVIAGVNWVAGHANKPAVANMSLGGGISTTLDTAVRNSIASSVTYAIAAGNSNRDACKFSPARVPEAITVGATTSTDARASYSNYGSCLDLFAPGSSITSAWIGSGTATKTISGTSMATPHVTGVAALYLGSHSNVTPQQVRDALVAAATPNVVGNPGRGSPNKLLYSLIP